ncbi:MAG: glycosyltransferase family 4 protein [Gammaproteobacteria bacterium]|nr:glycosyltransferase family 4 protein [Gammaproteobacteria bacterium]
MQLYYISPSVLPSRSANSVHVVHQCQAFLDCGADVTLFAKRSIRNQNEALSAIRDIYGVKLVGIKLQTYYNRWSHGDNIFIAIMALCKLICCKGSQTILSRNLYAAYILAVILHRKIIYETHQLEKGISRLLQAGVLRQKNVITLVISEKLKELIKEYHGDIATQIFVLHDAAPIGIKPMLFAEKRKRLSDMIKDMEGYTTVCGYFGHLYPGRGIEIIESLAERLPDTAFLVVGGNEQMIEVRRASNPLENVKYIGYKSHPEAQRLMAVVDVLLMPYQKQVSIGVDGHDTARWMSPMKMFEYLASGTPIVSSDLPVLREVLRDHENALLAVSDDPESWLRCLIDLKKNPELARRLGQNGHACYLEKHTWQARANRILKMVS